MSSKSINRNVRALILSTCLGVILTYAGVGEAQERGTGVVNVSPAQFGVGLQGIDRQLTSIEALFTQIETAKTTADKDKLADNLEFRLGEYAKAMVASFTTAVTHAEAAAKTVGKEGNLELLQNFEAHALDHEKRLQRLDDRAPKTLPRSGSTSEPAEGGKVARGWPMLEKISDFFISPARAAIALSVYTACHQNNPPLCTQYTAWGITQTQAAWVIFNACWNNLEGTRPKWWRAILRASCTTGLVVRLA